MTTAAIRRDQLVRAYIDAHRLAVLTIEEDAGKARVTVSVVVDWKRETCAVYFHSNVQALLDLANGIPAGLGIDDTIRLVEVGAERNRIRLTPHALLIERANGAISLIEKRLSSMKADGELRAMHQEYKDLRLHNAETGKKTPPFAAWIHGKKMEMVRAVAHAGKSSKT